MHHRSYQSILPTHNKLLQKRWDDTYYDEHRRRIKTASHMVSTNSPKQHPHVMNKLKKQQRESERFEVVQRDNETLMDHMSAIMNKGSGVDHRNDYKHWSLNYGKRVDEMQRIQQENKKMLTRIRSRPANYSVSEWLTDRIEKERLLGMITTHPPNQHTKSARPYVVRDRKEQSNQSLVPLDKETDSIETLDPSVTDTVESLERELDVAKVEVSKCSISKSDITELKSLSKPPVLVIFVLEAYAILLGKRGDKLWLQGIKLLTQHHTEAIHIDDIPLPILKKLQFYIENPSITPEKLKRVSYCIVSVWYWVESVYKYAILAHKYGIRAEEKGIKRQEKLVIIQDAIPAKPSPVKEKTEKSIYSLEIRDTDTFESLEKELDVAKVKLGKCSISKSDITELKSLSKPPNLVVFVLEAYAILLGKRGDKLWLQGKLLTQHHTEAIDIDNIPLPILKKLQFYIEDPSITPEKLKKVSCSIVSVWNWVESVYKYVILTHKYGIRAEEKGIKRPEKLVIIQKDAIPAKPSPVKEKTEKSIYPLEIRDTDTIESLEKELDVAKVKLGKCNISKNNISELKSLSNPPVLIKQVLEAYAILLGKRGDLWHQCIKLLAQQHTYAIDIDNITLPILKKMKFYVEDPDITHQKLKSVSLAILSIWEWIENVYHYGAIANKLDQLHTAKYSKENLLQSSN